MSKDKIHPYYLERKEAIISEFLESMRLACDAYKRLIPDHSIEALISPLLEEFERILPTLPYVGGAEGRLTPYFEKNAGVIALGRVLRARNIDVGTISKILHETYIARLANLPADERRKLGKQWLSKENQQELRRLALQSQDREHPGDFVYSFVESGVTKDGQAFDFGLDYSECGFCKLCRANGDEDILPMICAMDEEVYGIRGIKLIRTTTLEQGDSHCNFRYSLVDDDNFEK